MPKSKRSWLRFAVAEYCSYDRAVSPVPVGMELPGGRPARDVVELVWAPTGQILVYALPRLMRG